VTLDVTLGMMNAGFLSDGPLSREYEVPLVRVE
jgi:hypothetical protein